MTISVELRDRIRDRRHELGLTQSALAERIGVSQRWISRIETGRTRTDALRTEMLMRLAEALGLPYDELAVAAGIVTSRQAAKALRARASRADHERDRLAEIYDRLDDLLLVIEPADLPTLIRLAETLAEAATITRGHRPGHGSPAPASEAPPESTSSPPGTGPSPDGSGRLLAPCM
jgi:transcriptional regulator with XRE-family HTH domain